MPLFQFELKFIIFVVVDDVEIKICISIFTPQVVSSDIVSPFQFGNYIFIYPMNGIFRHILSLSHNKQLVVSSEHWAIAYDLYFGMQSDYTQTIHRLMIIIVKTMIMHVFAHHRNQDDLSLKMRCALRAFNIQQTGVFVGMCRGILHMQIILFIICCYSIVALVYYNIS